MGKRVVQRAICCPCGSPKVSTGGLCPTCYTLRRQDEEHFGGLREAVLHRDQHMCRVCAKPGNRKRSIVVHHRRPGVSELRYMLALCPS